MRSIRTWIVLSCTAALAATGLAACDSGPSEDELAEESKSLEADEAKTDMSKKLVVDPATSDVSFLMEAPLEHIRGRAPKSMQGELFVDFDDVTKSNGLVKVDLMQLELFQTKRESEDSEFGEEEKNAKQNAHMRTWLQISEDAPEDVREDNRWVEYKITKIGNASEKNIADMEGAERTITADVTGELRLHGRKTTKTAEMELTFVFEGDEPVAMKAKSLEPVDVGLKEHDVRPRSAFDKLAQKTLSALGEKVAESAPVEIAFEAKVPGAEDA